MATRLIQAPHYYGLSILAQTKAQPVIFLFNKSSTPLRGETLNYKIAQNGCYG